MLTAAETRCFANGLISGRGSQSWPCKVKAIGEVVVRLVAEELSSTGQVVQRAVRARPGIKMKDKVGAVGFDNAGEETAEITRTDVRPLMPERHQTAAQRSGFARPLPWRRGNDRHPVRASATHSWTSGETSPPLDNKPLTGRD